MISAELEEVLGAAANYLEAEVSFGNGWYGYGGKIDLFFHAQKGDDSLLIIGDWKTQKTKPGKGITFYDDWAMQLASYAEGVEAVATDIMCFNIGISSTEPGLVESRVWPVADIKKGFAKFEHLLVYNCLVSDYWPGAKYENYDVEVPIAL